MSRNKIFRCAHFSMHFRIKFLLFNDFPSYFTYIFGIGRVSKEHTNRMPWATLAYIAMKEKYFTWVHIGNCNLKFMYL